MRCWPRTGLCHLNAFGDTLGNHRAPIGIAAALDSWWVVSGVSVVELPWNLSAVHVRDACLKTNIADSTIEVDQPCQRQFNGALVNSQFPGDPGG
jgi:hypothetical protein